MDYLSFLTSDSNFSEFYEILERYVRRHFDFAVETWLQCYPEFFAVSFRNCRFHVHNGFGKLNQLEKNDKIWRFLSGCEPPPWNNEDG